MQKFEMSVCMTRLTPASRTKTLTLEFSVNRSAMTSPAFPAKQKKCAHQRFALPKSLIRFTSDYYVVVG